MRVMVIVKASHNSEAGELPDGTLFAEMNRYNEELLEAGVMLAGEGLHPSANGARVRFDGDERTLQTGPFPYNDEMIAGFWLWQVESLDDAIAWLKKAPFRDGEVEIRQVFETEDFADSDPTGELRRQEDELRRRMQSAPSGAIR